ncbi:HNH endonuclease [Obesumbacterium proteus]|uniref:HNH endonuclease n=1 Tax=Obesumbacterium proteus TaxID=82983 RepID=UPI00242DE512|nr:HNH endonuclease [Obesumbacterium proteus]
MDNKIARICWNSHGWKKPSGPNGKSTDHNSFEVNPGFGHEEWLFDYTNLIHGYQYSFLQPLNNNAHKGKTYRIYLYYFEKASSKKFCIGHIENVVCIDEQEAQNAIDHFRENGRLSKMQRDLSSIGLNPSLINENTSALLNFNIKFKPDDVVLHDIPKDITDSIKNHRYILLNTDKAPFEGKEDNTDPLTSDITDILTSDLSETEKDTLIKSRIGQGRFKENVINTWGGERCAVTLVNIREMLIASHIKPWRDCESSDERLDGANGILLCSHIDKLFDRYLITFKFQGYKCILKISQHCDKQQLKGLGIHDGEELSLDSINVAELNRLKKYIEHHNAIFNQNN